MSSQPVPILLYHSVAADPDPRFARWTVHPADFAAHLAYLAERDYRTLTVSQYVAETTATGGTVPPKTVVITFDDGFADFHSDALPTLGHFGLTATIYITTGYLGETSRWLAPVGEGARPMMSWSQVVEVHSAGIECGAHTRTHPQLDAIGRQRARREVVESKDDLERHLNAPVASFAYPHGYHSQGLKADVREAGYTSACAVVNALSPVGEDVFALSRVIVDGGTDAAGLARLLSGEGLARSSRRPVRRTAWRVARRAAHLREEVSGRVRPS